MALECNTIEAVNQTNSHAEKLMHASARTHQKLHFGAIGKKRRTFFSTWFLALIRVLCKACKNSIKFGKNPFPFMCVWVAPLMSALGRAFVAFANAQKSPLNMHQPFFASPPAPHTCDPIPLMAMQFFDQLSSGLFFYFIFRSLRVLWMLHINFAIAHPTHRSACCPSQCFQREKCRSAYFVAVLLLFSFRLASTAILFWCLLELFSRL